MKISVLTLFPEMILRPLEYSIVGRAIKQKVLNLSLVNIRDFGRGKYKAVDDRPYGGGVGMIMRVDVLDKAIQSSKLQSPRTKMNEKVILLDPKGKTYNQQIARRFSKLDHLILVCGHYEGVDERVKKLVDEVISIGDYVLTGGEIPAMVIIDSIARLLPGALAKKEATQNESFSKASTLEYPQYTRPEEYKNTAVPKVLLSGNHKKIEEWRKGETKT